MSQTSPSSRYRVVFVCLGNICRSPTAEGVFRHLVRQQNLQDKIEFESRGTGGWHVGEPPDPRSQECAAEFGVDISDLRASQFSTYDFEKFDRILVMDNGNFQDVVRLAKASEEKKKVEYLMSYSKKFSEKHVPDPYHGGAEGFRNVFRMIHDACENLLHDIRTKL